ncbi:hypothetical protein F4776DRAFT_401636 [Hypoxylon sp. NC0597]|nr:hypothetical protein F4776DRAFT_401636 [Hypoxylon sp. NC0597]
MYIIICMYLCASAYFQLQVSLNSRVPLSIDIHPRTIINRTLPNTNQQSLLSWRTSYAPSRSLSDCKQIGHPPQLAYISLAQNEPAAKVRAQLLRKMIQPCGPPPPREGEEPIHRSTQ